MKLKWDKYEAALLVDTYINTLDMDSVTKANVISRFSSDLRQYAVNNHIEIDEKFRNIAGVTMRLSNIEYLFTHGERGLSAYSNLDKEMYVLFKNKPVVFQNILNEAKAIITGKDVTVKSRKDEFYSWLCKTSSINKVTDTFIRLLEVEEFCLKTQVIKGSIFDISSPAEFTKVRNAIEGNRLFKLTHTKLSVIERALQSYSLFLKENESNLNRPEIAISQVKSEAIATNAENTTDTIKTVITEISFHGEVSATTEIDRYYQEKYPLLYEKIYKLLDLYTNQYNISISTSHIYHHIGRIESFKDTKKILMSVSWAKSDESESKNKWWRKCKEGQEKDIAVSTPAQEQPSTSGQILSVSFTANFSYAFTKPISFSYFGKETLDTKSWADLYAQVCKVLVKDYPDVFQSLLNKSIKGNGRIDFIEKNRSAIMTLPKLITDEMVVETNLSAKDIISKIAVLLKLCKVDYDNLVIYYSSNRPKQQISEHEYKDYVLNSNKQNDFVNWMINTLHTANTTAQNYSSAVKTSGEHAIRLGVSTISFFDIQDTFQVKNVMEALLLNSEFAKMNQLQHNRFSAALNKYYDFMRDDYALSTGTFIDESETQQTLERSEHYQELLAEKFVRGFRLGSPLEIKRFRKYYEERYGKEPTESDGEIQKVVSRNGIEYEGRVFSPKNILEADVKDRILTYVDQAFQSGNKIVYYDALYSEFAEDLQHSTVYNSGMLKSLLAYYNNGNYFLQRAYLTKKANTQANPVDEVRQCMKKQGTLMSFEEIEEAIPHIPIAKIKQVLAMNAEFISTGRGHYIHIDNVYLGEENLREISGIIQDGINNKEFISGNELTDSIAKLFPEICEKNSDLPTLGLRNAIAYYLKDQFSFNGNIISKYGRGLTMNDVFATYCKKHAIVTLDELNVLKNELGTVIYFDPVYENKLRISENEFVGKETVQFDIDRVDAAIERFCVDDYLPISAIQQFSLFPGIDKPWNSYLMESYVFTYSVKFKLLHTSFNANTCVGAIVRRNSEFQEYEQLLTDALAKSSTNLNVDAALDFLCNMGFLGKRHLSNIEIILASAKVRREQRKE